MEHTKPRPRFAEGVKPNPATLAAGRYGTEEMCDIWGAEKTFSYILNVQGVAAQTLSDLHPDIVPPEHAAEIAQKASLEYVDPDDIRELEAKKGHDVIAVNTSLEGVLSAPARAHVNKAKTSADSTEPAKGLQLKSSLQVLAGSVENLRDIILEKAVKWRHVPHMDNTHLYDALPTVAGRPWVHYAEALQSGLGVLKFFYDNSIMGKWGDATGNHHSATALGIDGIALQAEYCKRLGLRHMTAPAQVPALEFQADIVYALARLSETMNNIAKYTEWGRSDDVNIFINGKPQKQKGSSAMPHKDAKNGNPDIEEQVMSERNFMMGVMVTALANCEMPYARTLAASANMRIQLDNGFKFMDHVTRRLADTIYWLDLREDRAVERVDRSLGVVTSQQVMTYLTDHRKTSQPMARSEAHDLMGGLATHAWNSRTPFIDVLLASDAVRSRLDEPTLRSIADPHAYIGQSQAVIDGVIRDCYKRKTFEA